MSRVVQIEGCPVSKGSFQGFVLKHNMCKSCPAGNSLRTIITNDNPDTKKWQKTIQKAFIKAHPVMKVWDKECAIKLILMYLFERPKSIPKTRIYPVCKPDIDKLERATLDALTGLLYVDDSQVCSVVKDKRYGNRAGLLIKAINLTEQDKGDLLAFIPDENLCPACGYNLQQPQNI